MLVFTTPFPNAERSEEASHTQTMLLSLTLPLFALKSHDRKTFTVNCAIYDLFISRALNTIYMLMPSKLLSLMPPSSLSSGLIQLPISISLHTSNIHLNIGPTCPSPASAISVKGTSMQPDSDEKNLRSLFLPPCPRISFRPS